MEDSGIDSFDALVERLADIGRPILHEDHVMVIGGIQAEGAPPPPKPHQPPEMPVVLEDETNEPRVVREFDGQELYSTPGVNAKGDSVLYSFTTLEALQGHLIGARHSDICTANPDSLPELSYYYEDDDLGGDRLQNGPGRAWRDLRRLRRGFLGHGGLERRHLVGELVPVGTSRSGTPPDTAAPGSRSLAGTRATSSASTAGTTARPRPRTGDDGSDRLRTRP